MIHFNLFFNFSSTMYMIGLSIRACVGLVVLFLSVDSVGIFSEVSEYLGFFGGCLCKID